jgi:large subunit ribosomal protein L17
MRHNRDGRKLGRTASHRRALMRNMVTALFASERIETTTPKAKEVRRVAERMITFARRGDLAARRHVAKTVQKPEVLKKLFDEIAPRFTDRPGGYTRVLKLGVRRKGDNAERAILELLGEKDEGRKKKKQRKKYHKVDIPKAPVKAKKEKAKAAGKEEAAESEEKAEGAAVEEKAAKAEEKAADGAEVKEAEPEKAGEKKEPAGEAKPEAPEKPKGGKKK